MAGQEFNIYLPGDELTEWAPMLMHSPDSIVRYGGGQAVNNAMTDTQVDAPRVDGANPPVPTAVESDLKGPEAPYLED